jgi:hypothetical protein
LKNYPDKNHRSHAALIGQEEKPQSQYLVSPQLIVHAHSRRTAQDSEKCVRLPAWQLKKFAPSQLFLSRKVV